MSLFGTIMSKVFGHGGAGTAPSAPANAQPANTGAAGGSAPPPVASQPAPDTTGQASTAPSASGSQVDVAKVLDGMDTHGQILDWRRSIVDLMKLLGMDSSLTARKELAHELNYTGDTGDSAAMNIWLHEEIMRKFAENGGKLPDDLHHT